MRENPISIAAEFIADEFNASWRSWCSGDRDRFITKIKRMLRSDIVSQAILSEYSEDCQSCGASGSVYACCGNPHHVTGECCGYGGQLTCPECNGAGQIIHAIYQPRTRIGYMNQYQNHRGDGWHGDIHTNRLDLSKEQFSAELDGLRHTGVVIIYEKKGTASQ